MPNFIQINSKMCEKMSVEVSAFSHNCDLESDLERKVKVIQTGINIYSFELSTVYHHTNFERNPSVNV